jgi:hypothetical protein
VRVTDNGSPSLSDSKSFNVVVNEVNDAPVLAAIVPSSPRHDAQHHKFRYRWDLPANTLTFGFARRRRVA